MPKNIVICCDGTGNEFSDRNSNVVKLYQMLVLDPSQVAYYHPGVGTMGARSALSPIGRGWTKLLGYAFGYGASDNVADAYQFLMRTFEPGDQVYVFGFSRGAYTARVLCGMLHMVGLLREDNEGLIPYAIRLVKTKPPDKTKHSDQTKPPTKTIFAIAAGFKKTFSRECKPHFVGVWDTVSSLGWIYNAVHFPYTTAKSNPDLNIIRHAISIDERRAFFRQNLFGPPSPMNPNQDVEEVWFAGVHSDVGGSYEEDKSQLSRIALRWMLCEAQLAGLRVDPRRQAAILGGKPPYAPDPFGYMHNSLTPAWWAGEVWPKVVSKKNAAGEWKKRPHLNLARRRWINPDSNPAVHESVEQRIANPAMKYNPSNLPSQRRVVADRCPAVLPPAAVPPPVVPPPAAPPPGQPAS
ncbi:MAG TPA: DUF2235 domain-containing protein [Thermoanaerobaculia bacterium]|nr:DUF2235 domain-containing protein [Thermoanaerobaculia bacterium]